MDHTKPNLSTEIFKGFKMKRKTQNNSHHSGNIMGCEMQVYEAYTIYVDIVRVHLPSNVGHALHVTATIQVFKLSPEPNSVVEEIVRIYKVHRVSLCRTR